MVPFSFFDEQMQLVGGLALFWPSQDALLVSDLHLEKASYYAGTGQMLPPYDSRETLGRLAEAIQATRARRVIALGDNFHDADGPNRLEPHAQGMLDALTRAVDWIWITGNHDGQSAKRISGGERVSEVRLGGINLRHQAATSIREPEISGHFHPRLSIRARGRRIARPCAVMAECKAGAPRLILPAFGALTGGMDAQDPAIVAAMQPADRIAALVPITGRMVEYPIWRAAA